nr:hypothetical protein [Angustibacter aerolatus]
MRIACHDLTVRGAHGPMLQPTSLTATTGEVTLVAGQPGHGHTALALALAGRLVPAGGSVEPGRRPRPVGAAARGRAGRRARRHRTGRRPAAGHGDRRGAGRRRSTGRTPGGARVAGRPRRRGAARHPARPGAGRAAHPGAHRAWPPPAVTSASSC